ncbi:MAG: hypothetical protein V3T22_09920 [Planctomycetota bacterium]
MSETVDERLRQAEAFLQEAVYRSRDAQAGAALLDAQASVPSNGDAVPCGLGRQAVVVLDLSPRAQELYGSLWPSDLPHTDVESVRDVMAAWVRRQDALDRKRNHFLKDFRGTHGFDRAQYTDEQGAAYRRGLDAVNAEVNDARAKAARDLLQDR